MFGSRIWFIVKTTTRLPLKYSSINRHAAINFYLSVLIYPVIA